MTRAADLERAIRGRPSPNPSPTAVAVWAVAAVVVLAVVLTCGFVVVKSPAFTAGDLRIDQWLSAHHTASLDAVAVAIDWFLGPTVGLVVSIVATGFVALATRRLRPTLTFAVVVGVGWYSNQVVKDLVERPRPDRASLAHPFDPAPGSFSYPSGHTAIATVLVIAALAVLPAARRGMLAPLAVAIVLVVAASRVYLGVHYVSDVVAAMLWCSAAAVLLLLVCRAVGTPHRREHHS
ncbi:phosphatase PAP2 family protein [Frondihabitans cladoniiphilus]|uniref:Phosphatidic acid phosphatase type 2/haloperoxidase domain-containing protein n=1 Tax=Frondihabitans cladoniiphilus TaxID=715785 RepID=A0ABP8VJ73_9MICO